MSKIIINSPIGNNAVFGDHNTITIVDNMSDCEAIMKEIETIRSIVGNNYEDLNILINSINNAIEHKELSKIRTLINDSKNFILQLSANYAALNLDRIANFMGWI